MSLYRDTVAVCRMIKIEHSVFALPFAFTGAFLAQGPGPGWSIPSWRIMVPLTIAMIAVRSFAMAYNRLADLDIDRLNPRTQGRPLVTGELSVDFTKRFLFFCALVFTTACAAMNGTCLLLSPVALLWSAFYSHTKRFTPLCHFVLGSVLGLSPVAGWLAVRPRTWATRRCCCSAASPSGWPGSTSFTPARTQPSTKARGSNHCPRTRACPGPCSPPP